MILSTTSPPRRFFSYVVLTNENIFVGSMLAVSVLEVEMELLDVYFDLIDFVITLSPT